MKVTVHRKAHFNAAHRLYNPKLDDERNRQLFGKCANDNYHGHNYDLIVSVRGNIDPETGYVIDMKVLKDIIRTEVEEPFDHQNLNLDVPEFSELIPTAEHIAVVIWRRIRARIHEQYELKVTLYETQRNFVEYDGK